jgi:tRNA pseudouridine55 synthase
VGVSLQGVLNVNKPSGPTSRDVVNQVTRMLRRIKVGHAGTLDPLATGVLILCVGSTTRLIESIQRMPKTYRTVIRLGARSDTLDADGQVTEVDDPHVPDEGEIRRAIVSQVGEISQVPPEYSALKVQGRRAHELARSGQAVDLASRTVRIDSIELVAYTWPNLELEVDCGGGTYIRSIARDLGAALGCGGLVEVLVRTRIGPFTLEDAVAPAALTTGSLLGHLRSPLEAVPDLPRIPLDETQVAAIAQGRALAADRLAVPAPPPGPVALLGPDGNLIAIAEVDLHQSIQPRKVLV